MPELENPRHERFAQLRAEGTRLDEAYELAGFVPDRGHPSRLAAREDMIARVAELRAARADERKAEPPALIAALLEVAQASLALNSPAGVKEARLALLDVWRLRVVLGQGQDRDRVAIICEQEKRANPPIVVHR